MSDLQPRLEEFLLERNQTARFAPITPDASTREYYRISWNGRPAIACVYPFNELCRDQFEACLDVTALFLGENLPVARILASDEPRKIIVHEDFGDTILRDRLLAADEPAREAYLNDAIGLIARIQKATAAAFDAGSIASKLRFDYEKLSWELDFFTTHYFTTLRGRPLDAPAAAALKAELDAVARELEALAKVLTHRDYHAANLMLAGGELKIIDHQDARIGSAAYDLVSLLLDRVTTLPTPEWLAEKRRRLIDERAALGLERLDEAAFAHEFRLQTIQRCLKAIGTFSFQAATRGKTHFLEYIAPMFGIVRRAAENLERFPHLRRIIAEELDRR